MNQVISPICNVLLNPVGTDGVVNWGRRRRRREQYSTPSALTG